MIDGMEKTIDKLIDKIKVKVFGKTFRCPVCHLELSYHDVNAKGLIVCPLCGIVIEVTDVFGHPLPVVHDVEIKRYQPKGRFHPLATHLPIGLFPFSFLLSFFLLFISLFSPFLGNYCLFGILLSFLPTINNVSQFLLLNSVLFSAITFFTGLYDWVYRYEKRRYRLIDLKVVCSILFFLMGLLAFYLQYTGKVFSVETGLLNFTPENLIFVALYFILQFFSFLVLTVAGHLGGLLVFGK